MGCPDSVHIPSLLKAPKELSVPKPNLGRYFTPEVIIPQPKKLPAPRRFYPSGEGTKYRFVSWKEPKTFKEIEGHIILFDFNLEFPFSRVPVYDLMLLHRLDATESLARIVHVVFTMLEEPELFNSSCTNENLVRVLHFIDSNDPGIVGWSKLPKEIVHLKPSGPYNLSDFEQSELVCLDHDWDVNGSPNIKEKLSPKEIEERL